MIRRSSGPTCMASTMSEVVRASQAGIHRALIHPAPNPIPLGRAPSPALQAPARAFPAGGVRNAGRWPGVGSCSGGHRSGCTAPAEEHPGGCGGERAGRSGASDSGPARRCRGTRRCAGCFRATPRRVCHWQRADVQGSRRTPPHLALPGSNAVLPTPVQRPVGSPARARPVRGVTLRAWRSPNCSQASG